MNAWERKVVVVTGASQGIGKALCLALAPRRPRLVLASRDAASLEEVRLVAPGLIDRIAERAVREGR